jgi:hypothetical protein
MKKNSILVIGLLAGAALAFYMIRKKRSAAADRASEDNPIDDSAPSDDVEIYFDKQWNAYAKPAYKKPQFHESVLSFYLDAVDNGRKKEEAWKLVMERFKAYMQSVGDTRALGSAGAPLPADITTQDVTTLPNAIVNSIGVAGMQQHGGYQQVDEDSVYFLQQWKSRVVPQTVSNIQVRNKVYEIFKSRRKVSVALNTAFDMAIKSYGVKLKN